MKLTNEQIAIIDQNLIDKGVVYEEIKLELLDHIVTDIELETEESDFDVVFSKVMLKWEKALEETSSFWGNLVGPRIIIEKYSSLSKRKYLLSLLFAVAFSILMIIITKLNPEEYIYNVLKMVFSSVYIVLYLIIIISLFFIWKLKTKTIHGRFFQKNCSYLAIHLYIIYTFINGHTHLHRHYDKSAFFNMFLEWFMPALFFFMIIYHIMIAKEHFKIIKKYKLV
ncbi:hypothetical protein B6A10_00515 [Flavobacterium sp. L1I52]|uniref:DUF1129 domain-containing protein n=1 Tax=Flavobacterium pokkalii TaxID=1940408 RepID=A0ABR7ULQ0_9FLAO|nr:hypothetical protein [Flavobacterium pokkalii]MBD0723655.1 hypothetical protein [Flavobacterium pokkalii]